MMASNDTTERLVLCLDIGTTCTGATIVRLNPGLEPVQKTVTTWPGGDQQSSKTPTMMLYHKGKPMAFGAQCLEDEVRERASAEGWEEAKYFKLAVHPKSLIAPRFAPTHRATPSDDPPPPTYEQAGQDLSLASERLSLNASAHEKAMSLDQPRLPQGVSTEQVYTDWLKWACNAAREFFKQTSVDGASLMDRLGPSMHFIIGCPNAWGIDEQQLLRRALFKAGLISETESSTVREDDRLTFVSESEASVHFCLAHAPSPDPDWLKIGTEFAVIDAGGSTVDTCVYAVAQVAPRLELREVKASGCVQAGAIYPTRFFHQQLKQKLANSVYGAAEYVDTIVSQFDSKTKCKHSGNDSNHIIKFGFERDTDRTVNISKGRITLSPTEVSSAFQPCVDMIVSSLKQQLEGQNVERCLLVGGFGESPFLKWKLRASFPNNIFVTADEPSRKAVSEGAALFHINSTVVARAVKHDTGIHIGEELANIPLAQRSGRPSSQDYMGKVIIVNRFGRIAKAGQVIGVDEVTTRHFQRYVAHDAPEVAIFNVEIILCNQDSQADRYAGYCQDVRGHLLEGFRNACTVRADVRGLCIPANIVKNPATGRTYWDIRYKIGLLLGATQLQAVVIWTENGVERRSPASIVPNGLRAF